MGKCGFDWRVAEDFGALVDENLMTVGLIGPAKGLKGAAIVDIRTDAVAQRFKPGSELVLKGRSVTVRSFYRSGKRWVVAFAQITTREQIEQLRGQALCVDVSNEELREDEFYASELQGLPVVDVEGNELGHVAGLEFGVGQDRLQVTTATGTYSVPFVKAMVDVDLEAGRIVLDAPASLLGD